MALDDRGRLLLLNPSARAMFAVENGVAEGRSFVEVIRQKGLLDLVEEVRASAAPARHELELGPPVNRVVAARGAPLGLGGGVGRRPPRAPRRDGAPPARAGPERVRGQRLPRAPDAAHLHQGLPGDAPRRRARRSGARAAVPRGGRDARRAARPPHRRPARALQHRERPRHAGADAARPGRRGRRGRGDVRAADHPEPSDAGACRCRRDSPSARTGTGSSRSW